MLLILLGDKASAEIVKQLSEDEVQLVSREIARLEPSHRSRPKRFSKSFIR